MIRPVLTEVGIFLIPFVIYAAYLVATRSGLFEAGSWPRRIVIRLSIAAFVLTILSLILLAHFSGAPPNSTYVPAHVKDGKLIPGTER